MAPVTLKTRKGAEEMAMDEHPKPKTTAEGLAKLPSVFKKGGTVTAGTASVSAVYSFFILFFLFSCIQLIFFSIYR